MLEFNIFGQIYAGPLLFSCSGGLADFYGRGVGLDLTDDVSELLLECIHELIEGEVAMFNVTQFTFPEASKFRTLQEVGLNCGNQITARLIGNQVTLLTTDVTADCSKEASVKRWGGVVSLRSKIGVCLPDSIGLN